MLKLILSLLLMLFSAGLKLTAQLHPNRPSSYRLEKVNIDLKEDFDLFNYAGEDKEGFIWLSGSKGLNVFDGKSLVSYSYENLAHPFKGGSSNENYHYIERDTSGLLYIRRVNAGGFICFDPIKRQVVDTISSQFGSSEILEKLSISSDNTILTLSIDRVTGSYTIRHHQGNDQNLIIYAGILDVRNSVAFTFAAGRFWLSNGSQIMSIDGPHFRVQKHSLSRPNGFVDQIGVFDNRVYFWDRSNKKIDTWSAKDNHVKEYANLPVDVCDKTMQFTIIDGVFLFANKVKLFLIDSSGVILQNLSRELTSLTHSVGSSGLTAELVQIFVTHTKKVFLVSQKNLYRLRTKEPAISEFRQHIITDILANKQLSFRALAEDEEHTIYASFYNNIVRRKKGETSFTLFPYAKNTGNAKSTTTYSLNYWKGQLIWNNMLIDRQTGQYQLIGLRGSYEGHCTQYLNNDTLWVFPWWSDTLFCYDLAQKKSTSVFLDKRIVSGTPSKLIEEMSAIIGDATGRHLWIASKWDGISCIAKNGQLLKKYDAAALKLKNESIPSVYVLRLTNEGLWYGCNEGIGLLNPVTGQTVLFRNTLIENGLLINRKVFSILPDSDSSFLLGTSRGIVSFNIRNQKFCNLPNNHPLANIEFNRASAFQASDGKFYFGSIDGLYAFTTKQLQFYCTGVPISSIKLYRASYFDNSSKEYKFFGPSISKGLSIGPGVSNIEFRFSVPEYDRDVYYSYRILGQSDRWTPYNLNNVIAMYYLSPGDYILELKASTSLSDENVSYFSMPLLIRNEWYKRTWVILLFISSLLGLIVFIIRYFFNQRLRRQEELAALRIKLSSDLHDDVGSVLSGIAMQSEMLAYTAPAEQKSPLSEISTMSREVMESMRDIVWAMDSRKDKYENLLDRMRTFAERNLSIRNIKHNFSITNIDIGKFIDPEKRQTIYLIFKEAVTNIIRHSNCTDVQIELAQQQDTFYMTIHDNGAFTITHTDGLGINNMKMRAQKIGANLTINTDTGFTIRLEVSELTSRIK